MAAGALAEVVTEEVATNLEEVAQGVRRIKVEAMGYFGVGVGVGFAIGFYFGYKLNREKIRAEVLKEAEEQIEQIRELYQQKLLASEPKPELEEIVEERGYSQEQGRLLRPPVPVVIPTPVSAPPRPPQVQYEGGKDKDAGWDFVQEVNARTAEAPYVIHQEEFNNSQLGYDQTTYTYWAGDEVITDANNVPVPQADFVVGQENLKWGHGADDIDVVFIRNDKLELEIEVCRNYRSYQEEVLGLTRPEEDGLEHSSQKRPARKKPKRSQ